MPGQSGTLSSYAAWSNAQRAEYENEQLVERVRALQVERDGYRRALEAICGWSRLGPEPTWREIAQVALKP